MKNHRKLSEVKNVVVEKEFRDSFYKFKKRNVHDIQFQKSRNDCFDKISFYNKIYCFLC